MKEADRFALEGALAPPMTNGELNFDEPWQGRVFGMAWALCERGCFEWSEFQASLIEAIARRDEAGDGDYAYYDHFQTALESLLTAKGMMDTAMVRVQVKQLAERPHGHDHPAR